MWPWLGRRFPAEYSTEAGNPENQKHVSRLTVRTPLPRLARGVVMVDGPGLGSLAVSGSREALAYLPAADLAIVLVNAGNTVMPTILTSCVCLRFRERSDGAAQQG